VSTISLSNSLRLQIAEMVHEGLEGHIPSSFSIVDILISVYESFPELSNGKENIRFVLSKGHGVAALYVVLAHFGILDKSALKEYGQNFGRLGGHPDRHKQKGVEANSGSLGHGFPFAVGLALGAKIKNDKEFVVCLVGDGECQEGTIWEAAAIAVNQSLGNLLVIVDWNGSAAQLQPVENIIEKWRAFGFNSLVADGHNQEILSKVLKEVRKSSNNKDIPTVIIAKTVKGKGVSFVEGHGKWHHKIPTEMELKMIREELLS